MNILLTSSAHYFTIITSIVPYTTPQSIIMPASIDDLPYELLSAILEEAAKLNIHENAQYTYGLSQAPEPLQDVRVQRVVRGQLPPDTLKWNAVEAIRQVNRQCHHWASEYALSNLYITRWRGSER